MRHVLIVLLVVMLLSSCHRHQSHESFLQEVITVTSLEFVPSESKTNVSPTIVNMGGGFGIGASGAGPSMGGVTFSSGSTSEEFLVTYRCQHGEFTVDNENIYKSVEVGGRYNVLMQLRVVWDDTGECFKGTQLAYHAPAMQRQ